MYIYIHMYIYIYYLYITHIFPIYIYITYIFGCKYKHSEYISLASTGRSPLLKSPCNWGLVGCSASASLHCSQAYDEIIYDLPLSLSAYSYMLVIYQPPYGRVGVETSELKFCCCCCCCPLCFLPMTGQVFVDLRDHSKPGCPTVGYWAAQQPALCSPWAAARAAAAAHHFPEL